MTDVALSPPARKRPQRFDLTANQRLALGAAGGAVSAVALYAVIRAVLGLAGPVDWGRNVALAVHLGTVIPAIPLGAYVLLRRKGGRVHRVLGRIWLGLMFTTAVSTLFIRHLNDGNLSFIHMFTLLTFIAIPQSILSARQGRIEKHKRQVAGFYAGSLLVAGMFSFLPGRLMWHWAFG